MKTVIALWRGEVPLARTSLVYGLCGLLLSVCPLAFSSGIEVSPSWLPVVLVLSSAIMAHSPFIAVAIWRSAGRYSRSVCVAVSRAEARCSLWPCWSWSA